jgi:hypothetical protein
MICGLACSHARPDPERVGIEREATASAEMNLLSLSKPGEQHRVSPNHAIKVGSGFNSLNEQAAGDCMENSSLTTLSEGADARSGAGVSGPGTASNDVIITYVEDYRRLAQRLGMRAEAHVRFLFASLSGEAEYANSSEFSMRSSFLLAAATLRKETERLNRYLIKPDALALLKNNPRAFLGVVATSSSPVASRARVLPPSSRFVTQPRIRARQSVARSGQGCPSVHSALGRVQRRRKLLSRRYPVTNSTTR